MNRLIILILFLISSTSTVMAIDFQNRFSIGNPAVSDVFGVNFSLEYLRIFEENHALYLRTNQMTHSSAADYSIGYRYYFSDKATVDSWFIETGYKWDRNVTHTSTTVTSPFYYRTSYTEIYESEYARIVLGYQWIYFERMNLDFGIGHEYDLKDDYKHRFAAVLSLGLLF
ncbi:hypothetical protein ACRXCV_12850 [Halobacteriovorax sp. GFR7]|uniref:hypothetical protein n=1 Tax=unclassified Halobacteriovorax TaxID=2639665 RepID=UPI003D977DF1